MQLPQWLDLILQGLGDLGVQILKVVIPLVPVGLWAIWWLFAVSWKKLWPVLAHGAWAPVLLLVLISADAWSQLAPGECHCLSFVVLPNYWWQLGTVIALVLIALFCGWLQLFMGWAPPEYPVNPSPAGLGHGHGHAQETGHEHANTHAPSQVPDHAGGHGRH